MKKLMSIKFHDCCKDFCRDWRETINNFPPSDHSPNCPNYKTEKFTRISLDGSSFISEIEEANLFIKELESANEYMIEDVLLTRDQFEKMEEFQGF